MQVKYKNYTLVFDFSRNDFKVPTYVKELNKQFDDVSQAKRYIDSLEG